MSWSSPCQDSLLECQLHWLRWSYHSLHNLIFLSLTLKSFNHTLWAKVYEKSTAILKEKASISFHLNIFCNFFLETSLWSLEACMQCGKKTHWFLNLSGLHYFFPFLAHCIVMIPPINISPKLLFLVLHPFIFHHFIGLQLVESVLKKIILTWVY